MTPAQLADLHARCFTTPRPWGEAEFSDILSAAGTFLLTIPGGFLVGRVIADEAELLTIAVDPNARRAGIGTRLIAEFDAMSRARGAVTAFLEVAADNDAAHALYTATGWERVGCRRRYYSADLDAIVMRLSLDAV